MIVFFFSLSGISHAAVPAPGWAIDASAVPTTFSTAPTPDCNESFDANSEGLCQNRYLVVATNAGSEPTSGLVTIEDKLPAGLSVSRFKFQLVHPFRNPEDEELGGCGESSPGVVRCTYAGSLVPDESLRLYVYVGLNAGAAGPFVDRAMVSGGGAASVIHAGERRARRGLAVWLLRVRFL